MNYIVIDFEFNQAYGFEDGDATINIEKMPFEIIQIGACKLDENFEIIDTFRSFVKPTAYKRLHPFVERITKINFKEAKNGFPFADTYKTFLDFIGNDAVICTWGIDDMKILYKNIKYYRLKSKIQKFDYIDIQKLAGFYLNANSNERIGLKKAVETLNIEKNIKFHDALSDAIYTSKILKIIKTDQAYLK